MCAWIWEGVRRSSKRRAVCWLQDSITLSNRYWVSTVTLCSVLCFSFVLLHQSSLSISLSLSLSLSLSFSILSLLLVDFLLALLRWCSGTGCSWIILQLQWWSAELNCSLKLWTHEGSCQLITLFTWRLFHLFLLFTFIIKTTVCLFTPWFL